jgi:hypothetical protein
MRLSKTYQVFFLLTVAIVVLAFRWHTYRSLVRGDAVYEGVVAQELLAGNGFVTRLMPLGAFHNQTSIVNQINSEYWRSEHKFIGSQLRIAFVGALLGGVITPEVLRIASFVFASLTILIVVFLINTRFSPFVGFTTSLYPILSLSFQLAGTWGIGISTDTLLFICCCILAERHFTKPSIKSSSLMGFCYGLIVLHRYSMLVWFPFWLGFVFIVRHRSQDATKQAVKWCLAFSLACGFILLPLFVYSELIFHKLFPSYLADALWMHGTSCLTVDPWYTSQWPSLSECFVAHPEEFLRKFFTNLNLFIFSLDVKTVLILPLLSLGVISVIRAFPIAIVAVIFFFVWLILSLLLSPSILYHFFLLPVIWLLSAFGLESLIKNMRSRSYELFAIRVVCIGIVSIYIFSFIEEVIVARNVEDFKNPDQMHIRTEIVEYLNGLNLKPSEIVIGGDRPWELALDTKFRLIPLPASVDEFLTLRERGLLVSHILIPQDVGFFGVGELPKGVVEWRAIVKRGYSIIDGYRVSHIFSDKSILLSNENISKTLDMELQ